jgi:hypothetical protein
LGLGDRVGADRLQRERRIGYAAAQQVGQQR